MSFGDAFDHSHDLERDALLSDSARQAWVWSSQYPQHPYPRKIWPALPNSEAAHYARQWLNLLTVRDAAFLHALGIDPLG